MMGADEPGELPPVPPAPMRLEPTGTGPPHARTVNAAPITEARGQVRFNRLGFRMRFMLLSFRHSAKARSHRRWQDRYKVPAGTYFARLLRCSTRTSAQVWHDWICDAPGRHTGADRSENAASSRSSPLIVSGCMRRHSRPLRKLSQDQLAQAERVADDRNRRKAHGGARDHGRQQQAEHRVEDASGQGHADAVV